MLPRPALARIARRQLAARPAVRPLLFQRIQPVSAALASRRSYSNGQSSKEAADQAKSNQEVADAVQEGAKEGEKESEELMKMLKAKDEEIVDLMSRLRYAQADFQNLQRISQIEREKAKTYAITSLARSLLTTLDNLHMALHAIPENLLNNPPQSSSPSTPSSSESTPAATGTTKKTDPDFFTPSTHTTLRQLHEGVQLTRNSLISSLKSHGVEPFDAKGEPFDPNMHEALFEVPVPDEMEGKVVEVMKGGYKIGDRVLRAAQVGVGRKKEN